MLHDDLDRFAATCPDAPFAVQGTRRIGAKELWRRSNALAHSLVRAGIRPGDRVGLLSKNSIEYTVAVFGISKAGAVLTPLNYRLAPPELAFILDDSGARMLLASAAYTASIDGIRGGLDQVERYVAIGDGPANWEPFHSWTEPGADDAPDVRANPDADAVQMYTSGTTGLPKGAVLTNSGLGSTLSACDPVTRIGTGEHILMVLPMYHIFGLTQTLNSARWRGCLHICEDFNPGETARMLDEDGIQVAPLVPAMIQACLQAPGAAEREYKSLRLMCYAASPISEVTLRRAMQVFRCGFVQAYGMTELAPVTVLTEEDHERALRGKPSLLLSAGRVVPGCEACIVDLLDQPVPPGAFGEIVIRGPMAMRGYWNQPRATAEVLRGGWMHTGDAGFMDEEGYLYVQDRVKDMIVSGAENIYPREVEEALVRMPAIADAAVIGVPDEKWGEAVKALVVLKPGAIATAEQVVEFCRRQLAGYKRPRSVEFVEALPRNPSRKVLKRLLREPYWRGRERRVAGA
jgi:acyl-CoA synthetase (AMP-forming)/AMP-acid ligase II